MDRAAVYANLLATQGVELGVLGPAEASRIWVRHLLNSAAAAAELPLNATVVDVGSGAGLPGIPLALVRPDLTIVLLEPLERRVRFLLECVSALQLKRTEVLRGRAEEVPSVFDVVVARAVAPLDRLVSTVWPLIAPGGLLMAYKGRSVDQELAQFGSGPADLEGRPQVVRRGGSTESPLVTVVLLRRSSAKGSLPGGRTRRARLAEPRQ